MICKSLFLTYTSLAVNLKLSPNINESAISAGMVITVIHDATLFIPPSEIISFFATKKKLVNETDQIIIDRIIAALLEKLLIRLSILLNLVSAFSFAN